MSNGDVDWGRTAVGVVVPTVYGAGVGAAMSLVAKPQYRGAIIGTGAAFGVLSSALRLLAGGLPREKPPQQVGTNAPPREARFP